MENNRHKFLNLAEKRTRKTLKDIQLIGNLSNRSSYSYTPDDIDQIFRAIEGEIKVAKQRFHTQAATDAPEFSLR